MVLIMKFGLTCMLAAYLTFDGVLSCELVKPL